MKEIKLIATTPCRQLHKDTILTKDGLKVR
jgi:hypothetical protein